MRKPLKKRFQHYTAVGIIGLVALGLLFVVFVMPWLGKEGTTTGPIVDGVFLGLGLLIWAIITVIGWLEE